MIIRPASRKDCQDIYSLYQSEKCLSFTEEKVTSLFSTNLSHYLVLEEDQKILGFVRYLTDEVLTTFLAEIIIDKSHRRKGLGQQLIEEIRKPRWLCDGGCPSLSRLCFSASYLVISLLFYILTQSTFAKSHAKTEHGICQRI